MKIHPISMTKRSNLANNNDRSCHTGSPPSTSTMDLKEFASLLSEMLDPSECAVIQRKRRRRAIPARVSFAEDAFLYPSCWSIEDLQVSWYSTNELADFKKERKAVVRALKRANFNTSAVDQKKYCLRGYEPYFSMEMNKAVKYARERLTTTVFSEQKRQQTLSIYEPEIIRECSCNVSEWARGNSHEIGVLDSLEAFALTLNLDALSLQDTESILPESMSRQAKEQERSQLEKDIKMLGSRSNHSAPGAYHVDHAPEQDKDSKVRGHGRSFSDVKPGAYHVDYQPSVPEKQDDLRMRGPEHMDHEPVENFMQHALQLSINY